MKNTQTKSICTDLIYMHSQQLDCCHGNYRPNFLMFDEPSNHLDLETVEALAKWCGVGVT